MTSAAALVDLGRYPLLDRDHPARAALVARARGQLAASGACELPGFLTPEATRRMAAESVALIPRAHPSAGKSTPYLELPAPGWPEHHPRSSWNPFSVSAVAWDLVPETDALHALYRWEPLVELVADCLGHPKLFRYADPLGCCNVAVMHAGDELEWHFDQTDFVVSLALQASRGGGEFRVAPRIRSRDDERYEAVQRVLDGDPGPVVRLPMRPGTLLLFEGRHSLHRVSPIEGDVPRLVALLAYDTEPGTCGSELLQKARYGRVVRPA